MKKITLINFSQTISVGMMVLFFTLISCGSSQTAYQDDGIYDNDTNLNNERVLVKDEKSDYYQNYFSEERNNYYSPEDIVTDIDDLAYEGNDSIQTDTVYVVEKYVDGKPPWEESYSDVSVSFNFGVGFGYGWGGYYNPWYWGGPWYGYGWGGYYPYYPPYYRPIWGPYPPYYPGYPGWRGNYTYGKRYSQNTSRLNTSRFYNRSSSIAAIHDNRYRRNYSQNRSSTSGNLNNSVRNRSNYNKQSRTNNSNTRDRNSNYNKNKQNRSNQNYNRSRPSYQRSTPSYNRGSGTRGSSTRGRGHSSIDNGTKTIYVRNSKNNTYTPVKVAQSSDGKVYRTVTRHNSSNSSSNRKFTNQKQRRVVYVNPKGEVIKKPQSYNRSANRSTKKSSNNSYKRGYSNKSSSSKSVYSSSNNKNNSYTRNDSRASYQTSAPSSYSRGSSGGVTRSSSSYSRSSSRTR